MAGSKGIIPTRAQIIATRAGVTSDNLWKRGWGGNEGYEYWFARPVKENDANKCPLVILGGGRETTGPQFELYTTDDTTLNPKVSDVLKRFLPSIYPTQFKKNQQPEMEWVSTLALSTVTQLTTLL
jgi:hypothetical protein